MYLGDGGGLAERWQLLDLKLEQGNHYNHLTHTHFTSHPTNYSARVAQNTSSQFTADSASVDSLVRHLGCGEV